MEFAHREWLIKFNSRELNSENKFKKQKTKTLTAKQI